MDSRSDEPGEPSPPTNPSGGPSESDYVPPRQPRVSGLLLFSVVVGLGFVAGAGYYRFAAPRAQAQTDARLAEAPTTEEGRLEVWVEFAEPALIERVRQARISSQQPWIVTHTVADADGGESEVWGVESDSIQPGALRAEGLRAIVRLDPPRLLARTTLIGDHARSVPQFSADNAPGDPGELLHRIADYALQYHSEKLAKDIPGATLNVEIADGP